MQRIALLAVFLLVAGCSHSESPEAFLPVERIEPAALTCFQQVARRYGIEIRVRQQRWSSTRPWGKATYDGLPARDLAACAPVLLEELERYPSGFVAQCKLRQIILSGALLTGGDTLSAGISYPDERTIDLYVYADGPAVSERTGLGYTELRSSLHHELFHHFDDHQCGLGDRLRWQATNAKSFKYGSRQKEASAGRVPGFLSDYATKSLEEDRAEIFAALMVSVRAVEQLATEDPIIQSKIELMKSTLHRAGPEMDAAFWAKVKRRDERLVNPLVVALMRGWRRVEVGVDPASPTAGESGDRLVLRPTQCRGCQMAATNGHAITLLDASLPQLLSLAYNHGSSSRVLDLAGLGQAHYDLIASVDSGGFGEIVSMLRGELERQFAVRASSERRCTEVFTLTLAPGAGRMPPPAAPASGPASEISFTDLRPHRNEKRIRMLRASPSALAMLLEESRQGIGRPVIDETGVSILLSGRLDYEPGNLDALRLALRTYGLLLEPAIRPVDTLVVTPISSNMPNRPTTLDCP